MQPAVQCPQFGILLLVKGQERRRSMFGVHQCLFVLPPFVDGATFITSAIDIVVSFTHRFIAVTPRRRCKFIDETSLEESIALLNLRAQIIEIGNR